MDAPDRRIAAFAALEAHRRSAEASKDNPGAVFQLGVLAHSTAQALLLESASAFREAAARLAARGERSEAWERAHALAAISYLYLGENRSAQREIDEIVAVRNDSPCALATQAEMYYRRGDTDAARAALARAFEIGGPEHPLAAAVAQAHAERAS
jgi:tetratricopeptide (TPR) repeat protein